jgi:WD40 repeat-containing protein SMU1
VSLEGEVIQTFKSDAIVQEKETGNFVACAISPRKKWLYGLTDKGFLMCFSISQGTLEHSLHVSLKDVYGLSHHPHRNVIATFGNDGYVRLWRA